MTDYLWDKSGDPDPEVQRLEQLLEPFSQSHSVRLQADVATPARVGSYVGLALLAASVLIVIGGVIGAFRFRPGVPSWQVKKATGESSLPLGGWLETGAQERASFNVADIGRVAIEPNTRVRLLDTRRGHHSLELARGTLHATIWAPPNQFFVETPSTLAVDLGCAYTLTVDDKGAGLVNVLVGWVGFKWRDRESFIPAGSACPTRPHIGPGTPYNERVSAQYREALSILDFNPRSPDASRALTLVLDESMERDEVTLWHLLSRVSPADRDHVFERLGGFVPPPPGVTRDGIRSGNKEMLDAWWDTLGLGSTSLWRRWSQQWTDNDVNRR
jgi:hypothetical protein